MQAVRVVLFLRGLFTLTFEIGFPGGIKLASYISDPCAGKHSPQAPAFVLALLYALRVPGVRFGITQ